MSYEVVLDNKHYLRELIESITLKDSLEQIAYEATIQLKVPAEGMQIEPGQTIRISGVPFDGENMVYLLHPGVVWDLSSNTKGSKHITVVVYDRTIYLMKSEDEYFFKSGGTASQRLKKYATDWGIPLGNIPNISTKLSKATHRAQPIYNMITSDLQETVKKGGDMYIPRMTPAGLELFKIGSNKTVWNLEAVEDVTQVRTLEGAITKVKVIGNAEQSGKSGPDSPSPVLAIVSSPEIPKLGTLQKIVQDEDTKTAAAAKKLAQSMITGVNQTFTVRALDINTLRSGDLVHFNGLKLIVTSVTHELGSPGHMSMELASMDFVKRRYFLNYG